MINKIRKIDIVVSFMLLIIDISMRKLVGRGLSLIFILPGIFSLCSNGKYYFKSLNFLPFTFALASPVILFKQLFLNQYKREI